MVLAVGTRLGPYEILAPIGAGGMGEVYRARDTKLDRDVAIKVLPPSFAQDPERLARFEREAKVLASLNHPNIAQIYGIEDRALIMELVDGATLQGPLPLDTALDYARQIADALEAAHEKGIIHRDLKPANIMITPAGVVKVLDFGLAAVAQSSDPSNPVNSPTLTISPTRAGMILGTAAYMSPEQARGKAVDKRADIWAFGVVLYEMLTGKQLFQGETVSDTLALVLTKEPDWEQVPAKVRRLLKKCLEKDPKKRLRDITGAELLLEDAGSVATSRGRLPWIVAAALFAASMAAIAFIHFREKPPETPVIRSTILPPEKISFSPEGVALSPDGRRLAFGAPSEDGVWRLWLRSLDSMKAQPLAGTEGATDSYPFWSSDGRSIGFGAGGKLKRIDLSGGPPITLADAVVFRGGSWSPRGIIVFAPNGTTGPLQQIAARGGTPAPATALDPGRRENVHKAPWFLPDGRHFLYASVVAAANAVTIYVGSLDSRDTRIVAQANSNAVYASGHLLFLRNSTLMAQPFDVNRLATTGDAVPVAEQISDDSVRTRGFFAASANGTLAFQSASRTGQKLVWLDRTGKRLATEGDPGQFSSIFLSSDSKRAAVSVVDPETGNSDLWIYDLARNLRSRFTFDPEFREGGVWSPDGSKIIFSSSRKGRDDLYWKPASGAGEEELLYADDRNKTPTSWSRDGKFLMYYTFGDPQTGWDLWALPLERERKPLPFLKTRFAEDEAVFSPDGRWVAFESDESGRYEVYIATFPNSGGKRQVSLAGGSSAHWRADGKEMYYIAPGGRLMAADVDTRGSELEIDAVRPLFGPVPFGNGYQYAVSGDGQHFLAIMPNEQSTPEPLTLVQNWPAGLKK
jgi:serine/threonine protein kinase